MVIFLMKTSNFERDKKYLVKLKHLAISQDFLGFFVNVEFYLYNFFRCLKKFTFCRLKSIVQ